MGQEVKVLSSKVAGGIATIKKEVTDTLTEAELQQVRQQLIQQQLQLKNQANYLQQQLSGLAVKIEEVDNLLSQFVVEPE